jgi:hypothetical protein
VTGILTLLFTPDVASANKKGIWVLARTRAAAHETRGLIVDLQPEEPLRDLYVVAYKFFPR